MFEEEIEELDTGKMSIRDFVCAASGEIDLDLMWDYELATIFRLYVENGGQRYTFSDFFQEIKPRLWATEEGKKWIQ